MAMRIRRGDEVMVITGKDRGKRGRVQDVDPGRRSVVVAGVNIAKRHTKPNPQRQVKGGITDQPMPMDIAKVMVICPHCEKPARIAHRVDEDVKERVCKKCGETIVTQEKE